MRTDARRPLNRLARATLAFGLSFAFVVASIRPGSAGCSACGCTVSTTSLTFGRYVFTEIDPATTTASVSFVCTSAAPASANVAIALSAGGGTFPARTMRSGAYALMYNLYLDPAHASLFGDGTGGTNFFNSGTFTIGSTLYAGTATIYGTIPAGQGTIPAGSYSDTIVETISF